MHLSKLSCSIYSLLLSACSITPLAPIPRPLPEALEWAGAGGSSMGSFLGLKTRENIGGGFDDMEFRPGIKVVRVVENSPAAQAGLRVGDVLLTYDGVLLDDPETLQNLVGKGRPKSLVQLEVMRADTVFGLTLSLGVPLEASNQEVQVNYRLDPARSRAAWVSGRGGVVLVASHERAPFPQAGVSVGSVVTAIDGEAMHSERALIRNLQAREAGSRVTIEYHETDGVAHTTSVKLQAQPRRLTNFSIPILGTYSATTDGQEANFVLLDLWFISLFRYGRDGNERNLSILRFFTFQSGIGELNE